MTIKVICRYCNSPMMKTKKKDRRKGLQIAGLSLLFLGMTLLFFFPLGTFLGIGLMIVSAPLSHRQIILWQCPNCGYSFQDP